MGRNTHHRSESRRSWHVVVVLAASVLFAFGCAGSDGDDGVSPMVHTTTAGADCPSGGTAIQIGVDQDGDGALSESEVTSTQFACNGEGTAQTLVATEAADAASCPSGGIAIRTGVDDNDDGTLQAGEVDSTENVCNGEAPVDTAAVVMATADAPVANCPDGGTAISYGFDADGSGALDGGEESGTAYVCKDAVADPAPVLFAMTDEPWGTNCPAGGEKMAYGYDADGSGTLESAEEDGSFFVCDGYKPARLLDTRVAPTTDAAWVDLSRAAINQMILEHGLASPDFDQAHRPVVVFDWDNTVIKNDIGDATTAWLVTHSKILQPAGKDWGTTSPALTTDAKTALNDSCDALANAGEPLPTGEAGGEACAAQIFNIYYNGTTVPTANVPSASAPWTSSKTKTINNGYAWVSQLMSGYTPYEIHGFAEAAFLGALNAPIDSEQTVGGVTMPAWIRIYDEIRDLIGVLEENGFDVWVLTASPQYVVEALVDHVGLTRGRVIGIRSMLDSNGRILPTFQGCGSHADGNTDLITYYDGKRCWINKVIFGEPTASQEATNTDPAKRPVMVAGDSETDMQMLKDATALRLAIDRHKSELMCHALENVGNNWILQPMFIRPKSTGVTYDCPTVKDPGGTVIVSLNGGGAVPAGTF